MALWEDLGPVDLENYSELHEILIGEDEMHLLASPKALLLIEEYIQEDEDFAILIEQFNNPHFRVLMFARMWQFIDATVEYKLKTKAAPYIAAWGDRGMGKSEVLSYLVLRILKAYRKYTYIPPENIKPALVRDWGRGNTRLSQATEDAIKLVLHIDEIEFMLGTGSRTEYYAMIANLETIRVLMHTILCCTISLNRIKEFAEQADFVINTLFQDRINEVNYCMVYIMDTKSGMLRPVGIVDVPLHQNEKYRENYERMKLEEQIRFTKEFGRNTSLDARLEPIIQRLTDYIFAHNLEDTIVRASDLEAKLVRKKYNIGGHILNQDERRMAMKFAFDEIQERLEAEHAEHTPPEQVKYVWESDFTWREEISREMLQDRRWEKYQPFFVAREVEGLHWNKDREKFLAITGRKKSQNYYWCRKMDEDKSFQGWLHQRISIYHEEYLAQRFEQAGFTVTRRPTFLHDGLTYEEDLLVETDSGEIWINAKAGRGYRTYVAETDYKTTYILFNVLHKEALILYLDLNTLTHTFHRPHSTLTIGSGTNDPEFSKIADSSTPLSPLARALAPPTDTDDNDAENTRDTEALTDADRPVCGRV